MTDLIQKQARILSAQGANSPIVEVLILFIRYMLNYDETNAQFFLGNMGFSEKDIDLIWRKPDQILIDNVEMSDQDLVKILKEIKLKEEYIATCKQYSIIFKIITFNKGDILIGSTDYVVKSLGFSPLAEQILLKDLDVMSALKVFNYLYFFDK